jgi:bifunctional DNA-binding transcriptional regulator/antitoxin component of YhaV-PrlF toxin-antitoxin module
MRYFTSVVEEDENGDSILTFPEEFLQQEDWREGDEISIKVDGETAILKNISKEIRERSTS